MAQPVLPVFPLGYEEALAAITAFSEDSTKDFPVIRGNLLHTNQPPRQDESVVLDEALSHATHNLEHMEAFLDALNTTARRVTSARNELLRRKDTTRPVLHPQRRIPNDVLLEIFQHCVDSASSRNYFSLNVAPWVLTHVCSRWRTLITEHPSFWRKVDIRWINPAATTSRRAFARHLIEQITRSRSAPKDVDIRSTTVTLNADDEVLSLLLSTSRNWERLSLALEPNSFIALSPLSGTLGNIRVLNLEVGRLGASSFLQAVSNLSANLPHICRALQYLRGLQTLRVSSLELISRLEPSSFSQVQDLEARMVGSSMEHLQLQSLEAMPMLQKCTLWIDNKEGERPGRAPTSVIILRHLTELVMRSTATPSSNCPHLLLCLKLPALESLTLTLPNSDIIDHLIDLIRRSQCSITTLDMTLLHNPTSQQLVQLFELLPELTELNLYMYGGGSLVFETLLHHPNCVPNLAKATLGKAVSRHFWGSQEDFWDRPPSDELVQQFSDTRSDIVVTLAMSGIARPVGGSVWPIQVHCKFLH